MMARHHFVSAMVSAFVLWGAPATADGMTGEMQHGISSEITPVESAVGPVEGISVSGLDTALRVDAKGAPLDAVVDAIIRHLGMQRNGEPVEPRPVTLTLSGDLGHVMQNLLGPQSYVIARMNGRPKTMLLMARSVNAAFAEPPPPAFPQDGLDGTAPSEPFPAGDAPAEGFSPDALPEGTPPDGAPPPGSMPPPGMQMPDGDLRPPEANPGG
jgi:hypothetical protein